jgi:putative tryptophan/tyrosine transport system substrate-binding protein
MTLPGNKLPRHLTLNRASFLGAMPCYGGGMKRREFIGLIGGAAATWPLAAGAQQLNRMRRIGVLMGTDNVEGQSRVQALLEGLADLGWIEGRNAHIEVRYAANDTDLIRSFSKELLTLAPDVIVVNSTPAMKVVQGVSSRIPIVFVNVADPVGLGFVASIAHPGGNVTGFTYYEGEMAGKWIELLKEVAPLVSRVMVTLNPANPAWPKFVEAANTAASKFAVEVVSASVRDAAGIERAFDTFAREPNGGVIAFQDNLTVVNGELMVSLSKSHQLPFVTPYSRHVTAGALLSYGIDNGDIHRRAASYVDRILRGENAGELPVQAPTKFEMAVNLKTAKALGLTVPASVLTLADHVIE